MEVKKYKGLNNDSIYIREQVFIFEQGFKNEFDDIDKNADNIVVYNKNIPIGTGRVYEIGKNIFKLGRIAVIKEYRKQGIGKIIIDNLENIAINKGAKKLEISAQLQAVPFYKKGGYIKVGNTYMDEHVEHVSMIKIL